METNSQTIKKDDNVESISSNPNFRNSKKVSVSFADKVFYTNLKMRTLDWIFVNIQGDVWKDRIEKVRAEKNNEARKKLKSDTLMYFNVGIFKNSKRSNANFMSSEFMIFDFDHIEGDVTEKKKSLKENKNVYAVFISPSGDGLKLITRLETEVKSSSEFSRIYKYYAKVFGASMGKEADKTSDASRPCFISYDPNVYVNENAEPLNINVEKVASEKETSAAVISRRDLLKSLTGSEEGSRHTSLVSITGALINKGIDRDFALPLLNGWNSLNKQPLPYAELMETVNDVYDRYAEDNILDNFWSLGKDVYQMGFVEDNFFFEEIGISKFNIMIEHRLVVAGKYEEGAEYEVYNKLVLENHIMCLSRIDYQGDINLDKHNYSVDIDKGIIEVKYSPLGMVRQDNQLIEDYLDKTFGGHKDFIKKYLAVYCHSNYKRLPTLIFYGARGSGKTTFAEIMMEIFRPLSYLWQGNEQNFTPEVEKKLLVVEENNSDKASQYKTLKKYTGQKYALVNKKYKEPYQVKNNMNIIILSNEPIPLYLKKEELPVDEANNQFFVFEFKPFTDKIDASFQQKIIDCLGNYIRTELKTIYDSLEISKFRYSISVPITMEEKNLFNSNTTEIDTDTDHFIQKISRDIAGSPNYRYRSFLEKYLFPLGTLNSYDYVKSHKNSIIKNLKKRGYITADDPVKKQVGGKRDYCYVMTESFRNILFSEFEQVDL